MPGSQRQRQQTLRVALPARLTLLLQAQPRQIGKRLCVLPATWFAPGPRCQLHRALKRLASALQISRALHGDTTRGKVPDVPFIIAAS